MEENVGGSSQEWSWDELLQRLNPVDPKTSPVVGDTNLKIEKNAVDCMSENNDVQLESLLDNNNLIIHETEQNKQNTNEDNSKKRTRNGSSKFGEMTNFNILQDIKVQQSNKKSETDTNFISKPNINNRHVAKKIAVSKSNHPKYNHNDSQPTNEKNINMNTNMNIFQLKDGGFKMETGSSGENCAVDMYNIGSSDEGGYLQYSKIMNNLNYASPMLASGSFDSNNQSIGFSDSNSNYFNINNFLLSNNNTNNNNNTIGDDANNVNYYNENNNNLGVDDELNRSFSLLNISDLMTDNNNNIIINNNNSNNNNHQLITNSGNHNNDNNNENIIIEMLHNSGNNEEKLMIYNINTDRGSGQMNTHITNTTTTHSNITCLRSTTRSTNLQQTSNAGREMSYSPLQFPGGEDMHEINNVPFATSEYTNRFNDSDMFFNQLFDVNSSNNNNNSNNNILHHQHYQNENASGDDGDDDDDDHHHKINEIGGNIHRATETQQLRFDDQIGHHDINYYLHNNNNNKNNNNNNNNNNNGGENINGTLGTQKKSLYRNFQNSVCLKGSREIEAKHFDTFNHNSHSHINHFPYIHTIRSSNSNISNNINNTSNNNNNNNINSNELYRQVDRHSNFSLVNNHNNNVQIENNNNSGGFGGGSSHQNAVIRLPPTMKITTCVYEREVGNSKNWLLRNINLVKIGKFLKFQCQFTPYLVNDFANYQLEVSIQLLSGNPELAALFCCTSDNCCSKIDVNNNNNNINNGNGGNEAQWQCKNNERCHSLQLSFPTASYKQSKFKQLSVFDERQNGPSYCCEVFLKPFWKKGRFKRVETKYSLSFSILNFVSQLSCKFYETELVVCESRDHHKRSDGMHEVERIKFIEF